MPKSSIVTSALVVLADASGNVYLSIPGATSTDLPMTSDAWQSVSRGGSEAAWAKLSPDLSRLLYSTYLGGSGSDETRCAALDSQGTCVVGVSCVAANGRKNRWTTTQGHACVALPEFPAFSGMPTQT